MIYIVGMAISFLYSCLIEKSKQFWELTKKRQYYRKCTIKAKFLFLMSIFPLFLIAALRKGIGTDYNSYARIFLDIRQGNLKDSIEWGYILLNKLCGFITSNPQSIFILTSFLFCYFIFFTIYEQSEQISLSVIFLVISLNYCTSLNTIRQFLALSVCVYAFKYIYQKKLIKYMIFVFLASSIHLICAICFLFYFLADIKLNKKRIFFLLLIFVLTIPCYMPFFELILNGTKYYKLLINFPVAGKLYSFYMMASNAFFLGIIYHGFKRNMASLKNKLFLNLQVCSLALSLLLPVVPQIERALWIFNFSQFISVPTSLKGIKNKRYRYLLTMVIVLVMGLFFFLNIIIYKNHEVWPYRSILGGN